jgi:hypothetical protein
VRVLKSTTTTMTEERALVLQAVIDGQIGVEHVTLEEIFEAEDAIFEEVASSLTPFNTWETIQ